MKKDGWHLAIGNEKPQLLILVVLMETKKTPADISSILHCFYYLI